MQNFNKIIDLKFITGSKSFSIMTPRNGLKPDIKISGNITAKSYCEQFEIRVTNLFLNDLENITDVQVSAGYENQVMAGLTGKVMAMYTAAPGPDKETVIMCNQGNFNSLITKVINLKLKAGFSIKDVVDKLTQSLGFEPAIIDSSVINMTCAAPFYFNGLCNDALFQLKNCFEGVNFTVAGSQIKVFPLTAEMKSVIVHELPFLTQAPQFTGGLVNLSTLWNPMIKCGDYVRFPTKFSTIQNIGALVSDVARVESVQFNFSTTSEDNDMQISGTLSSHLNKEVK